MLHRKVVCQVSIVEYEKTSEENPIVFYDVCVEFHPTGTLARSVTSFRRLAGQLRAQAFKTWARLGPMEVQDDCPLIMTPVPAYISYMMMFLL